MPVLTATDIADMVVSTQRELGEMKFTDLTTDLQEHVAMQQLMQKNRVAFRGGLSIQFNALMQGDGNFRNVGLFDVDNLNQEDGLQTANVDWRHSNTGYTFDRRQVAMNSDPRRKIVDITKEKRYMSGVGLLAGMEANFWGEPTSSTDKTTPYGLKYWLVYNAIEGFNGGNNANFSAGPGGLSRTTYARWKNYTALYVNPTKTDLIRKVRKALWSCNFKPARFNVTVPDYSTGHRYGMYTTYDIVQALEELAEGQNDNLGSDLASKDGTVTIRRIGVEAVPHLQTNEATADPVVGIDWGVFKTVFLEGEYLREDPPEKKSDAHNVLVAFTDLTYNFVCYDCRRLFLIAKSTWH